MEGTALVFTVTKTGQTTSSFSVDYATAPATAASNDFSASAGSLTFTSSQTSKTISVNATADLRDEGNETFTITLSNPSGDSTIAAGKGIGTIWNDGSVCSTCLLSTGDPGAPDSAVSGAEDASQAVDDQQTDSSEAGASADGEPGR